MVPKKYRRKKIYDQENGFLIFIFNSEMKIFKENHIIIT